MRTMNNNTKNIIFDVGMVLIDFCWRDLCKNLGFNEAIIQAFDKHMISSPYWDMLDEGTIEEADAIERFIEAMPQYEAQVRLFWNHREGFVREYEYSAPLIRTLKQKGYGVYLLSNYPLGMYEVNWPSFAFFKEVDGYVVSAVEKMKKPDLAISHLLCERYHLNPAECIFIDDRQVNVDAAKQAGMQAVLFEDYEKLCSYLESAILHCNRRK